MKFTFVAVLLSSFLFSQSVDAQAPSPRSALPQQPSRPQPVSPQLGLSTSLGGLAGVAAGFGLAWGPALATDYDCDSPGSGELCGFDTLIILGSSTWGTPVTTALGIWLAGRASGGRGNYGLTLLGSAIGGTIGAGFAGMLVVSASRGAAIAGFMTLPLLEWAGGLIAYHLSHSATIKREQRRRNRMAPTLRVERGGASLQLSGAF